MMKKLFTRSLPLLAKRTRNKTLAVSPHRHVVVRRHRRGKAGATMNDEYAKTSRNQYSAHLLTRDLLSASMERLAKRCSTMMAEGGDGFGSTTTRQRIVDLGSADGSNSMETLQFAIHCLKSSEPISSGGVSLPLHITFEEHPASDQAKLQSCLKTHHGWFEKNDVTYDVLMKSFYEPLFERESVVFMMSYICLHWLDSKDVSDGGSISEWKTLGDGETPDTVIDLNWTFINEPIAPPNVHHAWRNNLAHRHLAKFLALRSKELKPGAELLLVMVGHPHEYAAPADGGASPLSRAMQRCVDRGELRKDVLHRTIIPYYMRTVDDIKDALSVAETLEMEDGRTATGKKERPGSLLELVDCQSVAAITKGGEGDILGGAFALFWSIHSHSVENAKPTEEELQSIKKETRRVFDEVYDSEVGLQSPFIACTFRRRTRERWGS